VEVTFTVTIRSDKGKVIEGVTVAVYTNDQSPAATAKTNNKGIATMNILVSQNYRVVLSNIPNGFAAKDSYTFSSTRVNINLSTVSVVSPTDHSKANYKVGSTMGDFTLTDTDGNIYTMSNLLKEKELIILDFWFVNCGPCKAEFPYFEAITEKYDNVQLLTLNHIDSEKDIIALREQMGVTFPMIVENIGF
jgi:thiol-disulfide isomerase/thioredoxin